MRKEQSIKTNNNQMEEKGMKSRFIHLKKRFVPALSGALMGVMLMSTTCFAAGTGTSAVTQPLENLKTLIIAVIGAVGVIILAKNVMEFAQAYQQQDSSTTNSITFFARIMTPTAPMTAIISVFKFSSGCVTAKVPVPAAKQVVLISITPISAPDNAGTNLFLK